VDGAGDVNGDGLDDIAVSEPHVLPANKYMHARGRVYVIFGRDSESEVNVRELGSRGFWVAGRRDMHLGQTISGVGDVDGDGFSDIAAVGAADNFSARVFIILGTTSVENLRVGELGKRGYRIIHASDHPLVAVDGGDDMNDDDLSDLVIGSPISAQGRGKAFVVWAKP
jgi:hypothetical protein